MKPIRSRKSNVVPTLAGAALLALLGALALTASKANATHTTSPPPPALIAEGTDDAYGTAVCFVTGAAGIAAPGVQSVATDQPDGLTDTDGGTFDFSSATVACAGTDQGGAQTGTVVADDFVINAGTASRLAEAEYTNLVCGTGHAEGSADLFDPVTDPVTFQHPTDLKTRFAISFVAGIGPLAINSFEGHVSLDPPALAGNSQDVDTGHGTGVVHITPDAAGPDGIPGNADDRGNCINQNVTGFLVDSAFTATLSGDAQVANDENDDNADTP